jgi:hypothetical protein
VYAHQQTDRPKQMYLTDDAALRVRLLTKQVKEITARVAEQLERAQDARDTSKYILSDLRRVRRRAGK